MRRKFGNTLSKPIIDLTNNGGYDSVIFIESDHQAALNTRAAALMFIGRNNLDLTTKVSDKQIFVMKDKDYPGRCLEIRL